MVVVVEVVVWWWRWWWWCRLWKEISVRRLKAYEGYELIFTETK